MYVARDLDIIGLLSYKKPYSYCLSFYHLGVSQPGKKSIYAKTSML